MIYGTLESTDQVFKLKIGDIIPVFDIRTVWDRTKQARLISGYDEDGGVFLVHSRLGGGFFYKTFIRNIQSGHIDQAPNRESHRAQKKEVRRYFYDSGISGGAHILDDEDENVKRFKEALVA